jgi:hypothetical protein
MEIETLSLRHLDENDRLRFATAAKPMAGEDGEDALKGVTIASSDDFTHWTPLVRGCRTPPRSTNRCSQRCTELRRIAASVESRRNA